MNTFFYLFFIWNYCDVGRNYDKCTFDSVCYDVKLYNVMYLMFSIHCSVFICWLASLMNVTFDLFSGTSKEYNGILVMCIITLWVENEYLIQVSDKYWWKLLQTLIINILLSSYFYGLTPTFHTIFGKFYSYIFHPSRVEALHHLLMV